MLLVLVVVSGGGTGTVLLTLLLLLLLGGIGTLDLLLLSTGPPRAYRLGLDLPWGQMRLYEWHVRCAPCLYLPGPFIFMGLDLKTA